MIACVTGASGLIGRRICARLVEQGYRVRALSRKAGFSLPGVDVVRGDLEDPAAVATFLSGAQMLFHVAAELRDESRMWAVNVEGTRRLLETAAASGIERLCHVSSVGVIGKADDKWVDEDAPCDPQDAYERSKLAAEQLAARGIPGCATVIVRPTEVVADERPGVLSRPQRGSWSDVAKVFLTGGECAHIVHADDVADAAVYLTLRASAEVERFHVSCDREPLNTHAELWALYKACSRGVADPDRVRALPHLPMIVPHLARRVMRIARNRGDVRYASDRLLRTGFVFRLGVKGAVKQIARAAGQAAESASMPASGS
jgi:nucleoside-diphosphate-sugar epimerase